MLTKAQRLEFYQNALRRIRIMYQKECAHILPDRKMKAHLSLRIKQYENAITALEYSSSLNHKY